MPAARSVAAVARPSARATDGRPVAAISGALRDGAPGSRCTLPPSWSTMSSSGARRPAGRGTRRSVRVSARTCAGGAEVGAQEDDAGGLAAADAREQRPRRRAPGEGEDDVLAGELRVGQRPRRGRAAAAGRRPPAVRVRGRPAAGLVAWRRRRRAPGRRRRARRRGPSPREARLRGQALRGRGDEPRRVGDVLELRPSRPASACSAAAGRCRRTGCPRARGAWRRRRCRCERAEAWTVNGIASASAVS